ncbi:MAG: 3-hydroxyacyl-CoA dehydrogenase NAD-binding domain-containing protein [Gemmatimonadota bacterium]
MTGPLAPDATIGVVGAGAMGTGIAQLAITSGHRVVISDSAPGAVDRARSDIGRALARESTRGRISQLEAASALERLQPSAVWGYDQFSACELIIEAVVERLDVKQEIFRALEGAVGPGCILATNTSSIPIAAIGGAMTAPGRLVGIHFFNPAPVMPLVEIIPGLRTHPAVTQRAKAAIERWGKVCVTASDTPGFIVNRLARPFYSEALRILDEGITDAATIDWAMRERAGFRMGPFELMDFVGHDVNYVVTETVWAAMYYDARYRPSVTQKRLLEAGLLGRKAGRGFYDYSSDAARPEPSRDEVLAATITMRILAMLVNEAVEALHLRIATAAELELAMTKGVNYPKGLLAWGDELGPARVLAELERLQAETGDDRYRPSVRLRRSVQNGSSLLA